MMNADNDAEFEALRAGFRAGIPAPGPVDEAAAAKLLAVMAELGGEELVGQATTLPEGVFLRSATDGASRRRRSARLDRRARRLLGGAGGAQRRPAVLPGPGRGAAASGARRCRASCPSTCGRR